MKRFTDARKTSKKIRFEWSGAGGFCPPLFSTQNLHQLNRVALQCLVLGNLFLRFLAFPFCFALRALVTAGSFAAAFLVNLLFTMGAGFHKGWADVTGRINQIAITRFTWLLLDSFAFFHCQYLLAKGLFHPEEAISILTYLKEATDAIAQEYGYHPLKWSCPSAAHVKRFTLFLKNHQLTNLAVVLAALGAETVVSINAGLRMLRGMGREFHAFGVNPKALSPHQAQQIPALLIHGDKTNQSAFIPLLDYLYRFNHSGPIFTLNVPSESDADETIRQTIIDQKINEIDALYSVYGIRAKQKKSHLPCLIIGHSAGAHDAINLEKRDITQRLLILIGSCKHSSRKHPQIYIQAKDDCILYLLSEERDDIKPTGRIITLETGHLGLLSHPKTFETCRRILSSKTTRHFFKKNTIAERHYLGVGW